MEDMSGGRRKLKKIFMFVMAAALGVAIAVCRRISLARNGGFGSMAWIRIKNRLRSVLTRPGAMNSQRGSSIFSILTT